MKNICFTIRNIDCGGGTERVGLRLANALVERGYNVHMVSYDAKANRPFFHCDERIKLWCILDNIFHRRFRWHFWYGAYRFRKYLKRNKIDVVIDIDTFNALWTAPAIKGTDIKWISWDHFNYSYCAGELRKKALQLVHNQANALVLISKADRETYLRETAFKPDFLKQIYNPLSFEVDHPIDHSKQKKVIAMGRIAPQKGFDLLLEAWKTVEKQVPDWQLEIVCGYGDYEALEQEARDMGLRNVVCTGPTKDVQGKMSSAAIFALSSRFEGFGLVLTEAAICSVPAVSFDCPCGPNEIITDGYDGLLVEPENVPQFAEKLITLMKDDELRVQMGRNAYTSAHRFSMNTILPQWMELIENL